MSNRSFVSKTVERLVVINLAAHANQQSSACASMNLYRQHHSTETAVISIHNDIVRSTVADLVSVLVWLDLSSAFATAERPPRLERPPRVERPPSDHRASSDRRASSYRRATAVPPATVEHRAPDERPPRLERPPSAERPLCN